MLSLNNSKNLLSESIKISNSHYNNKLINNQREYLFSYYYYFFDFIFNIMKPQKFCNFDKKYLIIYNLMCQIYDISSHIYLVKQFYILNNVTKEKINEEKEIHLKKLSSKININDNQNIENLRNEFKSDKTNPFFKRFW